MSARIIAEWVIEKRYPSKESKRLTDKQLTDSIIRMIDKLMDDRPIVDIYAFMKAEKFMIKACEVLKVNPKYIKSKSQISNNVMIRAAIARRISVLYRSLTLREIGLIINRDHSSVFHYKESIKDSPLLQKYIKIVDNINVKDLDN